MLKKVLLVVILIAVIVVGGGLGYLYMRKPAMAPSSGIRIEATPARIERGRVLFQNICDCDGCHSERDFTRFGGPVVPSGRGRGFLFPPEMGLPGTVVAPNITPDIVTGIGNWTDGDKIRAIRDGVSRDGRALFPMMPYPAYRYMSDEDVQAIVVYMNSLKPVRNALPTTRLNFPVSLLIKGVPQPAGSVPPVDQSNKVKWGEYLTTIGGCGECHTPMERGQPIAGKKLAGGQEFRTSYGVVVSSNITPDEQTGIGRWTEQQFLEKFYQYKEYAEKGSPQVGSDGFTLMPWLGLSQLSPEELGAIFAYLKTQKPVANAVETHLAQPAKTN